jgi:hypothetical protein
MDAANSVIRMDPSRRCISRVFLVLHRTADSPSFTLESLARILLDPLNWVGVFAGERSQVRS